jgi:sarcosine oxidase subunit alpha
MKSDVLIIGGGAAGLAAAYELAARGVGVTITDEGNSFGGQFLQQTQFIEGLPSYRKMRGFQYIDFLLQKLSNLEVDYLSNHAAIGVYEDNTIGFSNGKEVLKIEADKTIIAVGAAEKPLAFPGWTMPGVLTLGAVQIMINRERVLPGKRAVIVGSSDFAIELALQLQNVGVQVMGIFEREPALQIKQSDVLNELNIPVFLETEVESVKGPGEAEEVVFTKDQKTWSVNADLICVDGGRMPIIEPFDLLGCEIVYQEKLGGWLPLYNENFETSKHSTYLAGNCGGITTQSGVITTGKIAGIAVAESLGVLSRDEAARLKDSLWNELKQIESNWDSSVFQTRIAHIEKSKALSKS